MTYSNWRACARYLLLAAAGVALLEAGTAAAELADREKPVNIESDRLTVDDKKKESVFEGNVVLTQGSIVLRADRLTVRQDADGFNHATAYGKQVYFRQKREGVDEYIEGNADRIEYDGKQDKVQLFTNAVVKKGPDEVKGDYISYDAVTEFYQVLGGGKSAAAPGNPQGRVKAVLQPKQGGGTGLGFGPDKPKSGTAPAPTAGAAKPGPQSSPSPAPAGRPAQ